MNNPTMVSFNAQLKVFVMDYTILNAYSERKLFYTLKIFMTLENPFPEG